MWANNYVKIVQSTKNNLFKHNNRHHQQQCANLEAKKNEINKY